MTLVLGGRTMSINLELLQKAIEQGESTTRDGINGAETKDAKQMSESIFYSSGLGGESVQKEITYQPTCTIPWWGY